MLVFSLIYVALYAFVSLILVFTKKRVGKADLLFAMVFLIALTVISVNCIPGKTDDLYRHYQLIKLIREWKLSLDETFYLYAEQFLPIWGISLYYLSKLPHYFWLVALYAGITLFSVYCILLLFKKFMLTKAEQSLFMLGFFSVNSLFSINSGLRNQCVFGVGTLLFYLYFLNYINFAVVVGGIVLLGFLHPAAYIILICYVVSKLLKKVKWLLLLWMPLIKYIAYPLMKITAAKVSELTPIVNKVYYYFFVREKNYDIRQVLAFMVILIFFLYIIYVVKNKELFEQKFYTNYINLYSLLIIITIGSVGTTLLHRFMYLVAWFSLPLIMLMMRNKIKSKIIFISGIIGVYIILNAYNCVTLAVYTTWGII